MNGTAELTDEALESLVRRYRALGAQMAELRGEQDQIKAVIDQSVPVGWTRSVDGVAAHKREGNRSFDMVIAVSLLDDAAKAECVKTGYDQAKVRAAIESAGKIDECMIADPARAPVIKL